jgi:iron(III) transport system substrate-binding protein
MIDTQRHGGKFLAAIACVLALAASGCGQSALKDAPKADAVVNVYSSRHYDADGRIFAAFTEKTGIEVRTLTAEGPQLLERLKAEGDQSQADVIITVDAGNLTRFANEGVFQPVESAALQNAIPARLRDAQGRWFGFSKRARVIVYAKGKIDPATIQSMDDLAKPALKGKICVRTGTNVYNLSMLSARIAQDGPEKARAWAAGVKANFARDPQGSDTDQLRAVAAGACDVAIVNHYYLIRLSKSADEADRAVAEKLALIMPDQTGRGAHVNVSGAGVSRYAPNKANAIALLEFMAGPEAQRDFAALNDEFPVVPGSETPPELASIAAFKEDETPLEKLGEFQAQSQTLFDSVGWR